MKHLFRRFRFAVFFVAALTAQMTTAAERTITVDRPTPQPAFFKTCKHYENRAKFTRIQGDTPFEVTIAAACTTALASIARHPETSPYEARRAHNFLSRLTRFKQTILKINRNRLFGPNAQAGTRLSTPKHAVQRLPRVNRTAEYLIAREMGVLEAFDDWARTSNYDALAQRQ